VAYLLGSRSQASITLWAVRAYVDKRRMAASLPSAGPRLLSIELKIFQSSSLPLCSTLFDGLLFGYLSHRHRWRVQQGANHGFKLIVWDFGDVRHHFYCTPERSVRFQFPKGIDIPAIKIPSTFSVWGEIPAGAWSRLIIGRSRSGDRGSNPPPSAPKDNLPHSRCFANDR